MGYEVVPRDVGRRRRLAVAPLVVGLALVAVAAIGSLGGEEVPDSGSLPPVPVDPASVDCGELAGADCAAAVAAASGLLAPSDASIASVAARRSLLCGDDLECPRSFLAGARPVGSLVLTFDDGVVAWVNVVAVGADYSARVVRWFGVPVSDEPPPGSTSTSATSS